MNRRDFLGVVVGGVAISTAVRTWPFRVYSFPSDVKPVNLGPPMRRFYDTDVQRMKISPDQKAWLEDLRRVAWEAQCRAMEPAGVRLSLDLDHIPQTGPYTEAGIQFCEGARTQ